MFGGPVVIYVPSAAGTIPRAQRMRNTVREMLPLVRTSGCGCTFCRAYGGYTFDPEFMDLTIIWYIFLVRNAFLYA